MDPLLIVSPHFDDAVLSVGQVMAGRPDCVVVTVFAGTPARRRMLTTYDKDCGFSTAGRAMVDRRREDNAALNLLLADPVRLDFVDHQYGEPRVGAEIVAELVRVVDQVRPFVAAGPLGLVHPDHHATRFAFYSLLRARPDLEGWVYEDLPSRVLYPETVPDALEWWRGMGFVPVLDFLGTGPREKKQEAVACYRSQLWALDEPTYLVPERLWRLHRCDA